MQTYTQTDSGLISEQRLTFEPTLMAVIMAGGFGSFTHYDLPNIVRKPEVSAFISVTKLGPGTAAPAAIAATAPLAPVNFAVSPVRTRIAPARLTSVAAANAPVKIITATRLSKRSQTPQSFFSRFNGTDPKQDYVIRLSFPEPASAELVAVAMEQAPASVAITPMALVPSQATPALGLSHDAAPSAIVPAAIVSTVISTAVTGIEPENLAAVQNAGAEELRQFSGPAALSLEPIKFDLALIPKQAAPLAAAAGLAKPRLNIPAALKQPGILKQPGVRDRLVGEFIFHQAGVQFNDSPAGTVDVRIGGDASLSIRVSALLSIVEGQMDPGLYAAMSASASADEYVSFREIRAAGMDVRYDAAADRIVFTAD